MKTRNLLLLCLTAILIAYMKYVLPVMERVSEREMQWEILRSLHMRPSIQIPEPEPESRKL